jgi:hypothetical protein
MLDKRKIRTIRSGNGLHAALALAAAVFLGTAAHAVNVQEKPVAGRKKTIIFGELSLFAKDPVTWKVIKGGGRGKLTYDQRNGAFTFVAQGLLPGTEYALVRYTDAPPKAHLLARGRSGANGGLKVAGNWSEWTGKIWLVLGEDVEGEPGPCGPKSQATIRHWNPQSYLFEEKLLGVACDCPEEKPTTNSAWRPKRQNRQGPES